MLMAFATASVQPQLNGASGPSIALACRDNAPSGYII
jgi:hypothetical protein